MTRTAVVGRAAAFGALAALGHAPFALWPVSLVGLVALIWHVSGTDRPTLAAWAGGAGYFAVALHWIVEPFLVQPEVHGWMAPFALVLLAAGLALFWGAAGWIAGRFRPPLRGVAFALALTAAEMARAYVLTGFPWATPAYVWAETGIRLSAAWIGPHGLTGITLMMAAGIAALLVAVQRDPTSRLARVTIVGSVALPFLIGLWPLGTPLRGGADAPVIRLVQPNAPQDEKWHPETAGVFVRRMIDFTADAGADGQPAPDLVVWPEAAVPYPLDLAGDVLTVAAQAGRGAEIVTGINRRADGDWYNSLAVVAPSGQVLDTFDKVHLVPFGEYIPGRIDVLRAMAARSDYGFASGTEVRLIDTAAGRALPLICYEAIFPHHLRKAEGRADFILQITNDAWFGQFSGPFQHLDQARFRAIEQGLPLIRVANTGVSAVIDARGHILDTLPLGEAGWRDVARPPALDQTLYARIGDWPVALMLLTAFAGLAALNIVASRRAPA